MNDVLYEVCVVTIQKEHKMNQDARKRTKLEKCNCGEEITGIVRYEKGLKLCPDCFQYYVELKNELKRQPENEWVVYGTKIEGVLTKKLFNRIKKIIKTDSVLNNMGSQNPPLFEIMWECKSAKDAIEHGYTARLWYRCKIVGKTIVSMKYLANVDAILESLKEEPPTPFKRNDIDTSKLFTE